MQELGLKRVARKAELAALAEEVRSYTVAKGGLVLVQVLLGQSDEIKLEQSSVQRIISDRIMAHTA